MNPISAFFVRNIVAVFFFYGLAFFVMGVALALASRQASALRFVRAIRPLALFGLLHGIHEWIEMFQKIGSLTSGYSPGLLDEIVRLGILVASLIMLLDFGVTLLNDAETGRWRRYGPVLLMLSVWAVGCAAVWVMLRPLPEEMVAMADVLARYSLGIPGAILGTWALMAQQRTFREHDMPQFGQDLVWSAAASGPLWHLWSDICAADRAGPVPIPQQHPLFAVDGHSNPTFSRRDGRGTHLLYGARPAGL